jgi:aspartyl-tRNA(Asn)/glutamyl-tRNA(Gln) amidotransferase subunit C
MAPMSLSREEVEHIAILARLELTEEEKTRFRGQLSAILEHVAQLQKLDTASIPPTLAVFSGESHLREDVARPGLDTEKLLANAPQKEDNQFKVRPVFE